MMANPVEERIAPAEFIPGDLPVVFRGLVRHWPAVTHAERGPDAIADYLTMLDRGKDAEVMIGPPEIGGRFFYDDALRGVNFTKGRATVSGLIQQLRAAAINPGAAALYMGAAPMADSLPAFTADNPPPLERDDAIPRLWLGNAVTVQTHYDLSDNLACVVAGQRTFTLFPPEQTANLYVGPLEFTLAGQPVSLVRLEAPDHARFPRFVEAEREALLVTLGPGDAIYIPPLWWHHVRSHDTLNVLVNYWWRSARPEAGSPFECLVHGLLAIRDLPPSQREAWRAIFDHYVFAPQADGFEYLPASARGILGDLTPGTASMMRRFLVGSLTRG
ncbi:cupin-like domain-containing protein [Brevundimonas sp.]|uniref:cupin-like domain-containing protein n=1 Tax=Brevundimonas sp. TaxID=1871086 RepID=UPI003A92AFF7